MFGRVTFQLLRNESVTRRVWVYGGPMIRLMSNAINAVEAVVRAVAALDTITVGHNDDRECPFGCGWDEYSNEKHDVDCPIALARWLTS